MTVRDGPESAFKSLTETIDTTSAGGMCTFRIFGALAEF
jgi:DNA invertase Pin-like site-specific DNA recombinase